MLVSHSFRQNANGNWVDKTRETQIRIRVFKLGADLGMASWEVEHEAKKSSTGGEEQIRREAQFVGKTNNRKTKEIKD